MSRALLALGGFVWMTVALESHGIHSPQGSRPALFLPAESPGWNRTLDALLAAFDHADVVALGEAHGRRADLDLRIRLVRHPAFPQKVRYIVTELGGADDQLVVDRYLEGGDLSPADRHRARGTGAHADLVDVVREVNRGLTAARRLRVIGVSPSASDTRDRNEVAVSMLQEHVLRKNEKALVVFGAGHLWHREGGFTKFLQAIAPGRVFVVESLATVASGQRTPAHDELDQALVSLERTVSSSERPVVLSLRGTAAGSLVANPFYLGQAFLPAKTTLADLVDAVVLFGSVTTSQSTMVVGTPSPESLPRSSGLMAIEYQTKRLEIAEIEQRLRENGIRVRLDAPLDGATACVIKEVLRDLMAERGFADAKVAQRTTLGPDPGTRVQKVTFAIDEGKRSRPEERAKISPAARCDR
jgi:hypothetical protein